MSIQYSGSTIVNTTFTAASKAVLQATVMSNLVTAGWSQATGPSGGGSQTVTITIASPGVVSLTAHGLLANDPVVFATTGALPTGLTAATIYYVKTVLTSGTFTVSATAGGTVINTSGSQSGTQSMVGCCRMLCATTPYGIAMRIRIADYNGLCINFCIEDATSTNVTGTGGNNGGCIFPNAGGTTYRIVANAYQCFIWAPTVTPSRGFVGFGCLYVPSFLTGVTCAAWLGSNCQSDTDTTVRQGFRTYFSYSASSVGCATCQAINNANVLDQSGGAGGDNQSGTLFWSTSSLASYTFGSSQTGNHWTDGSALMTEPLMFSANSASGTLESLIRGQLWDAVVVNDTFTGDTTTTFAGHNWICITDNNASQKSSVFICTS